MDDSNINNDNTTYTLHIEGKPYTLKAADLPPYLKAWVAFEKIKDPSCTTFTHNAEVPLPLFDVAIEGLQHGYRNVFRRLGCDDLDSFQTLCETYNFLGVDIIDRNLDEIITDLKAGRPQNADTWRCGKGNKSKARDSAFLFLYTLLVEELADIPSSDVQKIYNAVCFVVSHPSTFKPATRKMIRKAYGARFDISGPQRLILDKWEQHYREDDNKDVTSSEDDNFENFGDSDSDY